MNVENVIGGYEKEIVEWIKNNYKKLGYDEILGENKRSFPDLIMRRKGKKIRVEVEIFSKYFLKHKHDPSKVDEVLCIVNDVKLPVKTVEIRQLKLWYNLKGEELVDYFKALPDSLLANHSTGEILYHFQDEWLNLSTKREQQIRKDLNMKACLFQKKIT